MSPSPVPEESKRGYIIPIGGAEDKIRDKAILHRFLELSGGRGASIAIIPTASSLSDTGERYQKIFRSMNGDAHVGFYDTITVNGKIVFESISHYYPNVLTAMRTRDVAAQICVTNRVEWPSYSELRVFGQKVIQSLGITTAPTHMEWFFGNEGLKFSEIACRPPGVSVWDLFSAINNVDIYKMWSNAICHGKIYQRPSRKFAGGMLSLRPNKDGRVAGYTGIEEVQKKYGQYVIKAYMPPEGSSTQPIEAGYRANAWMFVRHPDYDQLRRMMDDIGKTIKMWAD